MKVSIIVTLKKDVLDPQGSTIMKALKGMNFNNVNEVRQGKYFEIDIEEKNNKKAEKYNMEKAEELGITLPSLVFDDDSGIKISEYFDVYTYSQSDFQDNTMRENALKKLKELHESNVIFEENFFNNFLI